MRGAIASIGFTCALIAQAAVAASSSVGPTPSVHGAVTIKRDSFGTPHIYAQSVADLFYGYGYAAAEDRLFQLEMLKRTATGRVSEVLGPKYLEVDRTVVEGYDPASIRRQLAALPKQDRDIFEGVAAGINGRIKDVNARRSELLPQEFASYGFEPSLWDAFDVAMLWVGSMADRYSDINLELSNAGLLQALDGMHDRQTAWTIFNQLRWEHDSKALTTIDSADARPLTPPTFARRDRASAWAARIFLDESPISASVLEDASRRQQLSTGGVGIDAVPHASNAWVASSRKTTDGSAVLINGPQMGNFVPGWMWSVGLHGAGFESAGSTPIGFPFVEFGSNNQIAWGSTAGLGDTVDIYSEKLNPADPHSFWFRGSWQHMHRRAATIHVKDARDVVVEIFSNFHGTVSSFDAENHRAYTRRRTWEGRELESLVGWIDSTKARDWEAFKRQAARMAITINWYYADCAGNIGYLLTGLYPKRPRSQDFRLPANGDGTMEWRGFYPFSNNPQLYNPKSGFIANWNNLSHPQYNSSDYLYWGAEDHVAEISGRLTAQSKLSPQELWEINRATSFADDNARFFVPLILDATRGFEKNSLDAQAAQLIESWNRLSARSSTDDYESPAATIFRAWIPIMLHLVFAPDVPASELSQLEHPSLGSPLPGAPTHGTRVLFNALHPSESGVLQVFDFLHGRSPEAVVRQGWSETIKELRSRYGDDLTQWRMPASPHVFSASNYFGVPDTFPEGATQFSPLQNRGTENDWITLSRDHVTRCEVSPPGESGFISPSGERAAHYADQMRLYEEFACKPVWLTEAEVAAHTTSVERLTF
jgi:penicillin G amidase